MKILILSPNENTGGTERVASIYFKALKEFGYETKICSVFKNLNAYGIDNQTSDSDSLYLSRKNRFIRPLLVYFYLLKMKINGYSILVQGEYIAAIAFFLPFKVNIRITNCIDSFKNSNYLLKNLFLYSLRRHNIIAPHEKLISLKSFPKRNIFILPNPIERKLKKSTKFFLKTNQKENITLDFIAVGQLNFQKDHEFLIKTFEELKIPEGFKVNLDIFGSGIEEDNLKQLLSNLNSINKINLKGWSKSPWEQKNYIGHLLCSRWEGYPNVIVEAASYSIPTLSVPIPPCTTNIIKDNNIGLVSKKRTTGSFADLISCYMKKISNGENEKFEFDSFLKIHDPILLIKALKK